VLARLNPLVEGDTGTLRRRACRLWRAGAWPLAFAVLSGAAVGFPRPLRAQSREAADAPVLAAAVTDEPVRLDGSLDEPAWERAPAVELTQQAPRPGERTPYRMRVRLRVDAENLYFGIICDDPDPGRVAIHTLQRDADLATDDTVTIAIDTFLDKRTAYFFQINAGGSRTDGLISGPEELSRDWDGIWDAATRRRPSGWTAEIRIPASTLRFPRRSDSWGFNVERAVPRDLLFLRWSGATLDAKFDDLSRAGLLSGVGDLRQGLGLSIVPYALAQ
jgi:hypothetical protein